MIEHVLGGLAQVDDPFGQVGRADAVGHVLGVDRTGGVIVAANTADAAGDEMGVARIFTFHEDAVPAEDGARGVAFDDFAVLEIDLGENSQAAHDARDRIPRHFDEIAAFGIRLPLGGGGHVKLLCKGQARLRAAARLVTEVICLRTSWVCSRWSGCHCDAATWVPCWRNDSYSGAASESIARTVRRPWTIIVRRGARP